MCGVDRAAGRAIRWQATRPGPPPPSLSLYMAPTQPCAKYQYVLTSAGPKILPVPDAPPKDEESPADYNAGGYLQINLHDSFKDGRYLVVRKLGCVPSATRLRGLFAAVSCLASR